MSRHESPRDRSRLVPEFVPGQPRFARARSRGRPSRSQGLPRVRLSSAPRSPESSRGRPRFVSAGSCSRRPRVIVSSKVVPGRPSRPPRWSESPASVVPGGPSHQYQPSLVRVQSALAGGLCGQFQPSPSPCVSSVQG